MMTDGADLTDLTFEQALTQLQKLVDELENGDGSLEESLLRYEQGMKLAAYCNELLDKAELRVQELLSSGEERPFSGPLDSRS